ncbi:PhzF family phenazine biosynthesis protein [Klebsiella variicola]
MPVADFRQVDVFTDRPFKGNPVAVVLDATILSGEEMQQIANWTNLSETTFVLPPKNSKAHYRVRIFTPGSELPFAGHPTIGTAHALLEAGIIHATDGVIVQECDAGLVRLRVTPLAEGGQTIAFELPAPAITPLTTEQVDRLEQILGCTLDHSLTPALVDVGARWIVASAADAKAVLDTRPDYDQLSIHDSEMRVTGVCLFGQHATETGMKIEVRSFAPACGVNEDPVCGSGNGSVAVFLRHHQVELPADGQVTSTQGQMLGRDGKLDLAIEKDRILVGGQAVTCISGTITF